MTLFLQVNQIIPIWGDDYYFGGILMYVTGEMRKIHCLYQNPPVYKPSYHTSP